ncbi:TPA: ABC transporter ATP-binding protein [bacterium]|nr:ABC transporter ATP-binding protein [bacterium]
MKKVIEIRELGYSYPDGTTALKDINLNVFENETLGIIGPNGAGKSTFLLHLNGLLQGKGYISILDIELKEKNLKKIRSKIGIVFQDPDSQLFMPTVFEDVAFGPMYMGLSKDDVKKLVTDALDRVDMTWAMDKLSHHLSYGEKRRVSIATVLSMSPEILVLDEPSSNLDPKHRRNLINLLKELKITKLIATHDLDMVFDICTRVVLIDDGKIIADGNVNDILSDKALLESHGLEVPLSVVLGEK